MKSTRPRHIGRKLLGATVGLATLSLVGATGCPTTPGNLLPPPPDAGPADAPTSADDAQPADAPANASDARK